MPNHLHLLIQTKDANLSLFMKRLLGVYTIRFNRRHKRYGHLFQGRYKAYLIDEDSYFLQLSRYIHLNPVKAKLTQTPEDYSWSSLRFFIKSFGPDYLHKDITGKKELYRLPVPQLQKLIKDKDTNFQIYCLWKYGRLTQRKIGDIYSRTHAAVSQNIHRFQAGITKDKIIGQELDRLKSAIYMSEFKE